MCTYDNKIKKIYFLFFLGIIIFCSFFVFLNVITPAKIYAYEEQFFEQINNDYTINNLPSYYNYRDENILFTTNQDNLGMCWAYAAVKCFETSLAIETNELYDFSEAWIGTCLKIKRMANNKTYEMGAGSDILEFVDAIQNYGIVLESDFPYESFHYLDETNVEEYFEYYSQFANKDIVKNIDVINFAEKTNNISVSSTAHIQQIKLHVINNGSVYIGYRANNDAKYTYNNGIQNIEFYANTQTGANHGVSIIGWDDSAKITKKNGTVSTGAWICLNSWANYPADGHIYIAYDDASLVDFFGINVNSQNLESNLTIKQSTSDVKNLYKNYAKATYTKGSVTSAKQKNMFYVGDDFEVVYNSNVNTNKLDIDIYDGDKKCNSIFVEKTTNTITLSADDLDEGCYKIVVNYDSNLDGTVDETYYKQIFMTSGVIFDGFSSIGSIVISDWGDLHSPQQNDLELSASNCGYVQAYASHNFKLENAYFKANTDKDFYSQTAIFIGSYSKISNIVVDPDKVYGDHKFELKNYYTNFATDSNYSTGYYILAFYTKIFTTIGETYELDIRFDTCNGQSKTITFHYLLTDKSNTETDIVHINYLTNINNLLDCPRFAYYNQDSFKVYDATTPQYQTFEGWYTDKNLTNKLNANTVNSTDVVSVDAKTHRYQKDKYFSYVTLYPKYENIQMQAKNSETLENGTYNKTYTAELNIVTSGSGKYIFTVVSGALPNGMSFKNGVLKGTPLEVGSFSFVVIIYDEILQQQKTCSLFITVDKSTISFNIPSYESIYGETLYDIEPQLIFGTSQEASRANVEIECDVTANSDVGVYAISLTTENPNYNLTYNTDAVYVIKPAQIKANISDINCVYDGKYHTVNYQLQQNVPNVQITYSLDNINFVNDFEVKDYTDGYQDLFIKFETPSQNYLTTVFETKFNVSKRILEITLNSTSLEYNFKEQMPLYTIKNVVNGETLSYDIIGKAKNVGTHTLSFVLNEPSSLNYEFLEDSFYYNITKITLDIEPPVVTGDFLNTRFFSEIELPEGYVWQNPNRELYVGENIGYCTYYPENLEIYNIVTNLEVKIIKQSAVERYAIYGVIAVVVLVIVVPLSLVGISAMKRRRYK